MSARIPTEEGYVFQIDARDHKRAARIWSERRACAACSAQVANRWRAARVAVRRRLIASRAVMVRGEVSSRRTAIVSGAQTHGHRRKSAQRHQGEHGEDDEEFQLSYHGAKS
jgi:hypothetical protein